MDRDGDEKRRRYVADPRSRAMNPRAMAAGLLDLVGLDPSLLDTLEFTGPEIVLPSSYRVTEGAQALVAAVSAAVANLAGPGYASVSGQGRASPSIVVDSVETCIAFQSDRHLQQPGGTRGWDDLAGHYRTVDGHIQFHTNFLHHRDALLAATGLPPAATREDVAAVVAGAGRFELEQRVAAAGGIASALRTLEEWQAHPHSGHVADRAPVRITGPSSSGGDPDRSTPRPAAPDRPLAGLRVLDLTRVIAGPVCTRTLAAYGADVLRIGGPDVPVVRSLLPDTTLGKRFAHCDITTDEGRRTVRRLAESADVVVSGYRPGALDRHGVGRDDLVEVNPNLITASLSAFGTDGPWGARRGFDSITQTATGIVASETAAFESAAFERPAFESPAFERPAFESGEPRPLPCQFLDHGSGFLLTLGVLSALADRDRDGGGHHVEVSLLTTRNWLESLGSADPTSATGLSTDQVASNLVSRTSDYGPLRHARHPGRITGVPARWDQGPALPGSDVSEW